MESMSGSQLWRFESRNMISMPTSRETKRQNRGVELKWHFKHVQFTIPFQYILSTRQDLASSSLQLNQINTKSLFLFNFQSPPIYPTLYKCTSTSLFFFSSFNFFFLNFICLNFEANLTFFNVYLLFSMVNKKRYSKLF